MSRRFVTRRRTTAEEETVWISFSDLMTALVAVFMLAVAALVFSLTQEQEALAQSRAEVEEARDEAEKATAQNEKFDSMLTALGTGEADRAAMVLEIQNALAARGIRVEVDASNSVLRVPVELLGFDSGSSDIRPEYRGNVLAIGQVIGDVLRTDDRYRQLDTVFVEGHTDDIPIGSVFGGNWGLSTNRAISLWRLWEDELPNDLGALSGYTGEPLFSVSGYADTRPVNVDQSTEQSRAGNRRIDIRFTEHRLSQAEINAIRDLTIPSSP